MKLEQLDSHNLKRSLITEKYHESIKNGKITLPALARPGSLHVWHNFVIQCEQRDQLQNHLARNGIETIIHYPIPHLSRAYKDHSRPGQYPITENLCRYGLSLPIQPYLQDREIEYISNILSRFDGE